MRSSGWLSANILADRKISSGDRRVCLTDRSHFSYRPEGVLQQPEQIMDSPEVQILQPEVLIP